MKLYYNEIDPFCCRWLQNLIDAGELLAGDIDDRDIRDVQPEDLIGYTQCHFFAGIGGWPLALRLAGWPADREIWTGSCPCQPFSAAGKRKGEQDPRHLWPEFFRLIKVCRPPVIMGEQVAAKGGLAWLDGVFTDLEGATYTCRAVDTCAASVGAPHIRQRLFWVAESQVKQFIRKQEPRYNTNEIQVAREDRCSSPRRSSSIIGLALADGAELCGQPPTGQQSIDEQDGGTVRMGNANSTRHAQFTSVKQRTSDFYTIRCLDGKERRVGTGIFPLAYGLPRGMGRIRAAFASLALLAASAATLGRAKRNRIGRLKGYGNAIAPRLAAEFIREYMRQ